MLRGGWEQVSKKWSEVKYLVTCETQVLLFVIVTESGDGRRAIDLYIMNVTAAGDSDDTDGEVYTS